MKVIMIGTPVCTNCKRIFPVFKEYCEEHQVEYEYYHLSDAPSDLINIIVSNHISQAPAFFIYEEGVFRDSAVGDDIFERLKSFL